MVLFVCVLLAAVEDYNMQRADAKDEREGYQIWLRRRRIFRWNNNVKWIGGYERRATENHRLIMCTHLTEFFKTSIKTGTFFQEIS